MNTNFTPEMIETLRSQFGTLQRIDPCGVAWNALRDQLHKCNAEQLRTLAQANIKFVSLEAASQYKALDQPDSEEVYKVAMNNIAWMAGGFHRGSQRR